MKNKQKNLTVPSDNNLLSILMEGTLKMDIVLNNIQLAYFERYLTELKKWNRRINITSIQSTEGIIIKHFLDSLSVITYLPYSGRLADIGSGGGFPGIPLKIIRPQLEIVLIESNRKKANFLKHIIRTLNFNGIAVYNGRVEKLARETGFDFVVGRAIAELGRLIELSAPILKEGGILLAMKGKRVENEIGRAEPQMKKIGLKMVEKDSFCLPFNGGIRTVCVFQKNVSRETFP